MPQFDIYSGKLDFISSPIKISDGSNPTHNLIYLSLIQNRDVTSLGDILDTGVRRDISWQYVGAVPVVVSSVV